MTSIKSRIDRLAERIKPGRLTWRELVEKWRAAAQQGLYIHPRTGEPITFDELQQVDPARAARITEVNESEPLQYP